MSRQRIFTQEEINEIVKLVSSGELKSKEKLAKKFHTSKDKITQILKNNELPTNARLVKLLKYPEAIKRFNKELKENHEFIAICKKTGKEFKDYTNKTGLISKHIKELYNIDVPGSHVRTPYLARYNKFWHQQYFDIIQREIVFIIKPVIDIEARDKEIIRLYSSREVKTILELSKMFKLGTLKIRNLLKDNNVKLIKRGTTHGLTDAIDNMSYALRFKVTEGKELIAKCLKTGTIIKNIDKTQQNLSKFLKKTFNIITPKHRKLKQYILENNKSWYEQYFEFIEIDPKPTKKCHYCSDWETNDLTNRTGWLTNHITKDHGISIDEHLTKYPEESVFFKPYILKKEKKSQLNDYNSIKCEICGERFGYISHHHLINKHDITVTEYKLKYNTEILSPKYKEFLQQNMINVNTNHISHKKYISKAEKEIYEMFIENNVNIEQCNRKLLNGKEIDLLIDSHKLGIEFNGCKFHTEWYGGKEPNYHLTKTVKLNEKGYNLIHIFEDEWVNSKDLIINKLKHIVGIASGIKIGARKCLIKKINQDEKNIFLDTFHIQGSDKTNIRYGAYYNNILVGVMTFKKEFKDEKSYILNRFATNYDYNISGLASKIIKVFIKENNPSKIISFADRRWTLDSNNNMYTKLGFNLVKTIKPTYTYYNTDYNRYTRFHKFNFRKKVLLKKYPDQVTSDMTETEMAKILGFDRIWDCGLFKYELTIANS